MPELPEVETTVRGLAAVLEGRRIASIELRRPDLRRPFPADLRQRLTGARVTGLGRRANSGLIETEEGRRLSLNDPRRFCSLDLVPTAELDRTEPFARMGPEPLGDTFDGACLAEALAGRQAPIKAMLLDQRIVAGLGNIYVCEALHLARIAPGRAAGRISHARLNRLAAAVKAVLLDAIDAGGSTLRDYAQPNGELGYFSAKWRVYGREGRACPECGATIRRRSDSGRSTFFCPSCQRT